VISSRGWHLCLERGFFSGEPFRLPGIISGCDVWPTFADFPRRDSAQKSGYFCSSSSTMRRLCCGCVQSRVAFISRAKTASPLWPTANGPGHVRGDGLRQVELTERAGDVRAMAATSMVCVSRVRRWSPGAVEKKTWVLYSRPAEGARMDDAVAVALVMRASFGRVSVYSRPRVSPLNCAKGAESVVRLLRAPVGSRHN